MRGGESGGEGRGRRAAPLEDIVFRNCSFTRARAEAFPLKWRQVGAAYWWNARDESFAGVKGVCFDGCTFEEGE